MNEDLKNCDPENLKVKLMYLKISSFNPKAQSAVNLDDNS